MERYGDFSPPRASALKKIVHASEQERPDVAAARAAWIAAQPDLDPARLVFIDETGTSTNMARRRGRAKRGLWQRIGKLLDLFQPHECANFFANSGYART